VKKVLRVFNLRQHTKTRYTEVDSTNEVSSGHAVQGLGLRPFA
jgi:hypothetical protein